MGAKPVHCVILRTMVLWQMLRQGKKKAPEKTLDGISWKGRNDEGKKVLSYRPKEEESG